MKVLRSLITALLLTVSTQMMADNFAYLTVSQDGAASNFEVSKINKITFDASDMILSMTDGTTQRLPLSGLSKMFFSAGDLTSITSQNMASKFELRDGVLRIEIAKGERCTIYDLKGEEIFKANESVTLSANSLKKGVYLVKIGNEVKKILNK
ncbi:T9SS type A sorting domain-containing protein [Xylanibacter brevis]|uniref:T9SS type A sorting domain-containing protein n=1 Tax=Xylanibacter brevis TaxID=83231 RepID=UPI0004864B0D|nr:T9SS type A sorting domain-containing protein [Xylanibacter brevis]